MSSQLVGIADRYDRELAGVTDETLKRIFAAYDTSYRNLVKNLREAFPRLEQAGSISTLVRQGAIAAELGEALKFINPEAAKELERLGRDTIQQAGDLGQQMAGDALKYVGVQSTFTTVPVGAVRNQAERFRERLVNYSDQQASSISAVVEQGLIQGWGTRKIEGQLRGLGVSFKSNAETVARTETLSAYNGAARSRYEQSGVAYIQWIATPAEGTCSLCYARNTKVWKITEAPSIPAHPRCRCATLPVSSLDQIDTAFYESYSQDGLDDLARQKLQPDNGLTYWEKKAGATLAKPAWVPGQVIPKAEPLTANSLKWTRPANIPAKAKLQVVDIEQVWKDYQENGITLDLSDPATRARVDRLKADILNAVESGGKFTAPKLTFAKAGNEFNIPPGFDVTDGRHRITAFKELEFTSVKAYVDGDKPTATAKPAAAKADRATLMAGIPENIPDNNRMLYQVAQGETVEVTSKQIKSAREFMPSDGYTEDKIKRIRDEAGSISTTEARAIASYIHSDTYSDMARRIYDPKNALSTVRGNATDVDTTNVLAAQGLRKLEAITEDSMNEKAAAFAARTGKPPIKYDADRGLTRLMTVDNLTGDRILQKYQDALDKNEAIAEDTWFATSILPQRDIRVAGGVRANFVYKVTPRLDGNGQGRYVDHFKNEIIEGEVLYGPYSRFRVVGVRKVEGLDPTPEQQVMRENSFNLKRMSTLQALHGNKWKSEWKKEYGTSAPSAVQIKQWEQDRDALKGIKFGPNRYEIDLEEV